MSYSCRGKLKESFKMSPVLNRNNPFADFNDQNSCLTSNKFKSSTLRSNTRADSSDSKRKSISLFCCESPIPIRLKSNLFPQLWPADEVLSRKKRQRELDRHFEHLKDEVTLKIMLARERLIKKTMPEEFKRNEIVEIKTYVPEEARKTIQTNQTEDRYRCQYCLKRFDNPQAKGGHISKNHPMQRTSLVMNNNKTKYYKFMKENAKENFVKGLGHDYEELRKSKEGREFIAEMIDKNLEDFRAFYKARKKRGVY